MNNHQVQPERHEQPMPEHGRDMGQVVMPVHGRHREPGMVEKVCNIMVESLNGLLKQLKKFGLSQVNSFSQQAFSLGEKSNLSVC